MYDYGHERNDGEPVSYRRKLIEVALPLQAISAEGAREKTGGRLGHPAELHLWWSRKPFTTARAVLWSSLVDDPSAHPDRFPTEDDQKLERKRLFGILERLVAWENSNDTEVLEEARSEIEKSCDGRLPNVLDPFCGGGTIPLEAQRLGLPSFGGDLNPVAVLISKAMVEIPPRFTGLPPVNPEARSGSGQKLKTWDRAQGLAEDVRFYGQWMRDRAFEQIGPLYPKAALSAEEGGGESTVIAWLWARTVQSPDPSWSGHVPLVSSWIVRKAKGNKPVAWVEPVVDRDTRSVSYRIREGGDPPKGTLGRTAATCVATGTPIPREYIKREALAGRLGTQIVAIVAEGRRGRNYLDPAVIPELDRPEDAPSAELSSNSQYMGAPLYGMDTTDSLFTDRQLLALSTFSNLIKGVRPVVEEHARLSGLAEDGVRLRDGGSGAAAYADAVATCLAFVINRCADKWASLVEWQPGGEKLGHIFSRQAIPMVWDYAEANPFSSSTANWGGILNRVSKAIAGLPTSGKGIVLQGDAKRRLEDVDSPMICTDPPYYDNVPYADISDFFYVWLRHNLAEVWPDETATLLTPKAEELVANPHRAGSREAAREHFEGGMAKVLERVADRQHPEFPATIFYAFKQQETKAGGTASTGWETFLQGLVNAGLQITATWPLRTEKTSRMRAMKSVALASSVVIACRPRPPDAPAATLYEFRQALHTELSESVRLLQDQAIAPVDMAQSAIGPGMEVFSRYAGVIRADGTRLRVRDALVLINETLEGVLSEEEAEFDADTRWALTWYEQYGHEPGPSGEAVLLSQAKNTSVDGVVKAGIAESQAGKVWLRHWEVFDLDWIPAHDDRLTDWEVAQYLMVRLEHSESTAADLLRQVDGAAADRARRLVYLLYQAADRRGRTSDAIAYNSLVLAWFDIARQAAADHRGAAMTLEGT